MTPRRHARFERMEKLQALDQAKESAATPVSFVYRPGGTTSGSVFASWPLLVAAVNRSPGVRFIFIDGSFSAGVAHVPSGTWNVDNCFIIGRIDPTNGFFDVLQFDEGAHLTASLLQFQNILLLNSSSTAPITFTSSGGGIYFTFVVLNSNVGKAPVIRATSTTTHLTLIAVQELTLGDSTTPVLQCDAPTEIELQLSNHSIVFANATIGTGTIDFEFDSDTNLFTPQGATIFYAPQSKAVNNSYAPSNLANWSGTTPTSVANALDRIAAKITPIP